MGNSGSGEGRGGADSPRSCATCSERLWASDVDRNGGPDPSSFANHRHVRITHAHIRLFADFTAKQLVGSVEYDVEVLADDATELILDWKKLSLKDVSQNLGDGGYVRLQNAFSKDHGDLSTKFGRGLHITLPEDKRHRGDTLKIRVSYATTPTADAIQWLEPEQTEGKKHPYLFTQCQAIHCRTLVPIQDTPGNKITWTAAITVPAPLVALMSAVEQKAAEPSENKDTITYFWEQKVPVASYLIALAIGDLKKKDIGPRSCVWTEESMLEASAAEFVDTEKYLQILESIAGPYVWGRYDLLVLPKSFPYGGMENPCLTYVTPTLLAGDRSLMTLVAHEIAHSWFGNLVTCDTWEHFWLNEGFTVYAERKLLKALSGEDTARGELHRQLDSSLGDEGLKTSCMGHPPAWTLMVPNMEGLDPDETFSRVPYEKGFQLLYYLETEVVKSGELMNDYLKDYVKTFQKKTLTTPQFKKHFINYFKNRSHDESHRTKSPPLLTTLRAAVKAIGNMDWDEWFNTTGMPLHKPPFHDSELVKASKNLAARWAGDDDGKSSSVDSKTVDDITSWSCTQKLVFFDRLLVIQSERLVKAKKADAEAHDAAVKADAKAEYKATNQLAAADKFAAILTQLDAAYHFSATANSEIRYRWLTACVRAEIESSFELCRSFLAMGRGKFARPLYADLHKSVRASAAVQGGLARAYFESIRSQYHPITVKWVSTILYPPVTTPAATPPPLPVATPVDTTKAAAKPAPLTNGTTAH